MGQHERRNISMMMDLYELTMANAYFVGGGAAQWVAFDVFYRKNPDGGGFAIFAGLEQVVDYIEDLHFDDADIAYFREMGKFDEGFLAYLRDFRFKGDIDAFQEGSIMYPGEPILTVRAPLVDAQLVETAILSQINHQSMIATKARRIVSAAQGRPVWDYGARRAHNVDAAVYGARAAYIGGASGTSNVMAGKQFGIPVGGTMAHSWIMVHGDEYEAFRRFAGMYPDDAVLLVDTYDVMRSGVPNAIRAAREVLAPLGKRLKGIRLDSGDLASLSKRARAALDAAGLEDCRIFASNSLDEYTIASLLAEGSRIDGFGVGERLITSHSDPVFGAVYKLVAVEEGTAFLPRIKISETAEKVTNPGLKRVYRIYSEQGQAIADLITGAEESLDLGNACRYVDPQKPWQERSFANCSARELQHAVIKRGKRVRAAPGLEEIRAYVEHQLRHEIWKEEQRFDKPHVHYVRMSPRYRAMKLGMLQDAQAQTDGPASLPGDASLPGAELVGPN